MKTKLEDIIFTGIPFMVFNLKWQDRVRRVNRRLLTINALYTPFALLLSIIYIASSLESGAPVFSDRWYQNRRAYFEQQETKQRLKYQNSLREEFQRLDRNYDAAIDSTEFIYRK